MHRATGPRLAGKQQVGAAGDRWCDWWQWPLLQSSRCGAPILVERAPLRPACRCRLVAVVAAGVDALRILMPGGAGLPHGRSILMRHARTALHWLCIGVASGGGTADVCSILMRKPRCVLRCGCSLVAGRRRSAKACSIMVCSGGAVLRHGGNLVPGPCDGWQDTGCAVLRFNRCTQCAGNLMPCDCGCDRRAFCQAAVLR